MDERHDRSTAHRRAAECRCRTDAPLRTRSGAEVNLNHIVVGVDGTLAANAAARWAARQAALRDIDLTVVHVAEATHAGYRRQVASLPGSSGRRFVEHREVLGQRILNDALDIISKTTGPRLPRTIAAQQRAGPVAPTLRDLAAGPGQMLVIGSHSRSRLSRALGSVAGTAARTAHCPVAVIRHRTPPEPSGLPIVVAIDNSAATDAAVAIAFDEACRRSVDVIAVHAHHGGTTSKAQALLARKLTVANRRHPHVTAKCIVVRDSPAAAILTASAGAQLVVMGRPTRNKLVYRLFGSVGGAVLQTCQIPIVITQGTSYSVPETRI